jgi:pectate lyase
MRRIRVLAAAILGLVQLCPGQTQPSASVRRIPAFPGAEGYGMFTTGGRGGEVYEVTNLNDSGPGSLRDAVSKPNRTIVFRVSGNIELQSTLMMDQPNITIAGQTAPGEGICLKNYALRVNTRNIIVRYLRVRPGDQGRDRQVDGISMGPRGGSDWIFDHCSVSWGIDENFSVYGLPNVTVQWCIISEGLWRSNHPKQTHSMGGILNGHDMTMHHNIFISNNDRNPKFNIADWWPGQNTDFRNNVVYNWGARATWGGNGGSTLTNVVNNYYKAGSNSRSKSAFLTLEDATPGEWFVSGNVVEGFEQITKDNWSGVTNATRAAKLNAIRVDKPFSAAPVLTQSAADAYRMVLDHAGASFPKRDSVDTRVLREVAEGSGKIIDSPREVGGWPELKSDEPPVDNDRDGMADAWEQEAGLNPTDPEDRNADITGDGYTNLEKYLNSLVTVPTTIDARVKPAEPFWPFPTDGTTREDDSPTLRWKAGFAVLSEKIYFGTSPKLTEADLKAEKQWFRRNVEKQVVTSSMYEPGELKRDTSYYWRVDGVNEYGTTTGPTWSFTPGAPVAGPPQGSDRMEAENMTLGRVFVEDNRTASGAKVTSIPGESGSLRFTFDKPNGTYTIKVCYIDERDGAGQMSLAVNGKQIDNWTAGVNNDRYITHETEKVQLKKGDVIKLTASRNRDELGRIDYIETTPTAP